MNNGEIDCGESLPIPMPYVSSDMGVTEARDWGRKEYQDELLGYINTAISELKERDIEGHLWWGRFKELVNKVKP